MGSEFAFKYSGQKAAMARLEHITIGLKRMETMGKAIAEIARKDYQKQFATEGKWMTGNQWKPLAKMTQEDRKAFSYPPKHPILQRSKEFARSFYDKDSEFHRTDIRSTATGLSVKGYSLYATNSPWYSVDNAEYPMIPVQEKLGRKIVGKLSDSAQANIKKVFKRRLRDFSRKR